ncbi:ADP-ribose pyrophosphatase [Erwinia sp. OLTSP20]|uniref:NUDIX hydrolase n=1 Tax=unclassified Erwinia TaxID=2622719 RepID=UPI000C18A7FD|nr:MULTISPECIES: NUDIX hydrolase [unclassified Erwinia]PIJ50436.1 ADP-ribose pyrophosphatase [Erwinia sp. OAMSP11]PIJ72507.1 ADP-ribose pyrophosphatase [Erwinia sp. OLSSP12]PIJ81745.1 ADP-ribose pyrophosphatase [Erwinia sp. OLCASP19]PIJ84338.1 ADP-ribose pyrophosphatase [Erwinia sp. OLMTSP26]PIJ86202.1 ADP-ribose pyrophosphatase [Erwinia sp. OLMDSP33]
MNPIALAQKLQALAQSGLTFSQDKFDIERYQQLRALAAQLMAEHFSATPDQLEASFSQQQGYATPKVDSRGLILRDGKLLMVREAEDGGWSLPGGWVDVGDAPRQAAEREVREETGLEVRATRLLGVWDRNQHGHPPHPFHIYKLIFLCEEQGGELAISHESLDIGFFAPDNLPPLSLTRIVPLQIETSLRIALEGGEPWCD